MEIADIIAKAKVLLEALPYIQDFRGSIFVVKYGGSFMDDPDPTVRLSVATDLAFSRGGRHPCRRGAWRRQGHQPRHGRVPD